MNLGRSSWIAAASRPLRGPDARPVRYSACHVVEAWRQNQRPTRPEVYMSPKVIRPPAQIKEAIQEKAHKVREASTELSDRIQRFEAWLNKLPGRVEASTWRDHPDHPHMDISLGLRFH